MNWYIIKYCIVRTRQRSPSHLKKDRAAELHYITRHGACLHDLNFTATSRCPHGVHALQTVSTHRIQLVEPIAVYLLLKFALKPKLWT